MHKHTWKLTRHNLDLVAYVFIGVGIFFAVPQVIEIYDSKDASGVSLMTWAGWSGSAIFWIFYGWYRRIRPIFIGSFFKLALNLMIVYGVVLYG